MEYESGELIVGDAENEKVYFRFRILYKTALGSVADSCAIKFYADESSTAFHIETLTASNTTTRLSGEYATFQVARSIRYKITGDVTVYGLELDSDMIQNFKDKLRFISVNVQYKGAPSIQFYVDNDLVVMKPIISTLPESVTSSGSSVPNKSGTLYFPEYSVGYIPHYVAGGSGEILSVNYNTESI